MSNKKIERALYGPSWTEVIIGAILSFGIGAVLAVVFLIVKPVEKVAKELPKEADRKRGVVYYVEGSKDATKGRTGAAKEQSFIAGKSVSFNEDELNSLFTSATPAPAAPPKGAPAKAAAAPAPAAGGLFAPTSPNFRVADGQLQIAVPTTLNAFGLSQPVTLLATGTFEKGDAGPVFVPDKFYIGSLLASRLPFFKNVVMSKVMSAQAIPGDLSTAWQKLASATIEDRTLNLTMP